MSTAIIKPTTVFALTTLLFCAVTSQQSRAAMVATDSYLAASQWQYDQQQLLALIERDAVQQQLQQYGVTAAEAEARINAMTHAELLAFNDALQNAPAGEGLPKHLVCGICGVCYHRHVMRHGFIYICTVH